MPPVDVAPPAWLEAEPVVVRDVFPATVTLPSGGQLRSARAVVTRERVYVWTERGTPAITESYDPAASALPRINAPRSSVTSLAVTGGTLRIEGQRGCGCGNPLRGWTPWRPYRKASTP